MANKKRIIIADDEPDILSTLTQIFELEGYKVYSFDNGRDCLWALETWKAPPLLMILDVMMPEMSGWEIHRRLQSKSKWKKIKIVFLTGRTTETAIDMYKKYGIEYIQKPFDLDHLKGRIKDILESNLHLSDEIIVPNVETDWLSIILTQIFYIIKNQQFFADMDNFVIN